MSVAIKNKKKQLAKRNAELIYRKSLLEFCEDEQREKLEKEIKQIEFKIKKLELQLMKPERVERSYQSYKKRYAAKKGEKPVVTKEKGILESIADSVFGED